MPTQRQIDNWKRVVERGKWRFIRINYISFGLNMMVAVHAFEYIMTKPIPVSSMFTGKLFLQALIAGIIGGAIFAFGSWFVGNLRFGKHLKN